MLTNAELQFITTSWKNKVIRKYKNIFTKSLIVYCKIRGHVWVGSPLKHDSPNRFKHDQEGDK